MRSLGLSFGSEGEWRASEFDLCPGSSERMSDGSQRGAECEKTLLNLAFILVSLASTVTSTITRVRNYEESNEWNVDQGVGVWAYGLYQAAGFGRLG